MTLLEKVDKLEINVQAIKKSSSLFYLMLKYAVPNDMWKC